VPFWREEDGARHSQWRAALQLDPQTAGALRAGHADTSKEVTGQLSQLSQVELATVESMSALTETGGVDKLRYMRGSEPLAGYDALSPDEIATALSAADAETVNAVRDDERKFACRRQVMEEPRESFRRRRRVHEKRATGKSKTRAYMRDSQVARKPAVAFPVAGRRRRSTTDVDAPPAVEAR
jgi:hypothetical protein